MEHGSIVVPVSVAELERLRACLSEGRCYGAVQVVIPPTMSPAAIMPHVLFFLKLTTCSFLLLVLTPGIV